MKKTTNISINDFVRRQTKNSGKTYAEHITFDDIITHAKQRLNNDHYTEGYRDGVILVEVSSEWIHHFITLSFCIYLLIILLLTLIYLNNLHHLQDVHCLYWLPHSADCQPHH